MQSITSVAYSEASPSGLVWTDDNRQAGWLDNYGYYLLRIPELGSKIVGAHVVVWMLHHGPVPAGFELDHKDRDKGNNLIGNLRCVTHLVNMQNVSHHSDAAHPVRGLDWHKAGKCWRGRHTINGVTTTRRSVKREVVEAWLLHVQSLSLKEIECALTSTSLS